MQYVFSTPEPPVLYVEIGAGRVQITATDSDQTTIEVTGHHADEVEVEQRGHEIVVIAPKRVGFFGGGRDLHVEASIPTNSELVTRLGSADLTANGTLGWVKLNSGSGDISLQDVSAEAVVKCGSGDIEIASIEGPAQISSGSGDIEVAELRGPAKVSTGSGDVTINHAAAVTTVKSGSGDLKVRHAASDIALTSGSGELRVDTFPAGKLTAKNASGDIHVGIPAGVPVWTDVMSVSGQVRSDLQGAGQPSEGQPYVEVRAKTASGNVNLHQL